jgi:hypothetical protein
MVADYRNSNKEWWTVYEIFDVYMKASGYDRIWCYKMNPKKNNWTLFNDHA